MRGECEYGSIGWRNVPASCFGAVLVLAALVLLSGCCTLGPAAQSPQIAPQSPLGEVDENATLREQCQAIALGRMPEPIHSRAGNHVAHWAWADAFEMEVQACIAGRS
jgi:hypothetical protein